MYFLHKIILSGIIFLLLISPTPAIAEPLMIPKASPANHEMPIQWHHAYSRLVTSPEWDKLGRGEIISAMNMDESGVVSAQTLSLIKALPESCYRVVRKYDQYRSFMPYTVESRIIRSFTVKGERSENDGVDFWTRINVWGSETRYLIRIIHLEEPTLSRYRCFWTLVEKPFQIPECLDSEKRPCENDLSTNVGSHQFEPYPENPEWTLHTYTLKVGGKHWFQKIAFDWGGTRSMREVIQCLRKAVRK